MIVAGIGCRKGSSIEQVRSAVAEATALHDVPMARLAALATNTQKAVEPALQGFAALLGVGLRIVDDETLRGAAARCLTKSAKSLHYAGVPSLAEAAALASTGDGSRLLGPRLVRDGVTCALAQSAEDSPGDQP